MKLHRASFVFALALLCISAHAQSYYFERSWDHFYRDFGHDVVERSRSMNSGYMVLTSHDQVGNSANDAALISTDAQGQVQWAKRYKFCGSCNFSPPGQNTMPAQIRRTPDGKYAVCGNYEFPNGDLGFLLMKVDSAGAVEWSMRYDGPGSDYGTGFTPTSDSGFVICGTSLLADWDPIMIKTNASGVPQWMYRFPMTSADNYRFTHVDECPSGGYIIGGHTGVRKVLVRISESGTVLWWKEYSNMGEGPVIALPDGFATASVNGPSQKTVLLRTDTAGTPIWAYNYSNFGYVNLKANELARLGDGSYVIAGSGKGANQQDYMLLTKTDSGGALTWSNSFGPTTDDYSGSGIEICSDGGLAFVGSADTAASGVSGRVHFARVDWMGNSCSQLPFDTAYQIINSLVTTRNLTPISFSSYMAVAPAVTSLPLTDSLFCVTVGIPEIEQPGNFSLFPNPSSGTVTLSCDLAPEILSQAELKIISLEGKLVKTIARGTLEHGATLSLNDLAPGMYFYSLEKKNELLFSGKLVVLR